MRQYPASVCWFSWRAKETQVLTRGLRMKKKQQTPSGLQVPGDTSLVSCTTSCAQADVPVLIGTKPARQPRRENTRDGRGRMSAHSVFVLGSDGKPLTPTTPAKARKLLEGRQARKAWSKFGTFGIQMSVETRKETPLTVMGYDIGTKYEGIVVVSGTENVLAIKLDLPDKKHIARKIKERKIQRNSRHRRKHRRRGLRINRSRKPFLAPSQFVVVNSRLKVLGACFKIYSITVVGNEDVRFNHHRYKWGANFSTMEYGKTKIRNFFEDHGISVFDFRGFETEKIREYYGYSKNSNKFVDKFNAHCSDALALACEVGPGVRLEPCELIVVDDTYRPVRRKLHKTQYISGGVKPNASCGGSVYGLRKGLLVGTSFGREGKLCGYGQKNNYRYLDKFGKRQRVKKIAWVSNQFLVRKGV